MDSLDRESVRIMHKQGRRWLIVIFVALLAMQVFLFLAVPPETNNRVHIAVLCEVLWQTMLLIGMWQRFTWARAFLILVLVVGTIASVIYPTWLGMSRPVSGGTILVFAIAALVQLGAIWVLSCARGVKALMRS